MDIGVEARKLAIEIIASLVHIKNTMAELLLKPSGVPVEIYRSLLYKKDDATGKTLSKRQIAPLILDAIDDKNECNQIVRQIIEIAANWNSFHLADNEYSARATVQKAREFSGTLKTMEAREAMQRELARKEELARMEHERVEIIKKQSELLLMMFDNLFESDNPHQRGFLLQDLLNRLFDLYQIPIVMSFTRNEGAEQIDGAYKMDGWHYIVECRWRKKLADIRELDGLKGQVDRSGKQTMGLFLSINGWSKNVVPMLKQNPEKSIILMDGYDLRCVLSRFVDLKDFLISKIAHLNLQADPFLSVADFMKESKEK